MQFISSFDAILGDYDGFLIDLWGVIHDGTELYDGARESLQAIRDAGKRAVLVSNAPRRAKRSADTLEDLGIPSADYHDIITSGEVSYRYINNKHRGKKYYYVGPDEDADILNGLGATRVDALDKAEFVYVIGHYYAYQPLVELKEELETMCWLKLPMICANPDIDVVKMDGTIYPCAGEIARYYRDIGGHVHYFGKPYPTVYIEAKEKLGLGEDAKLLAIGDNLDTDIAGGAQQGMDTLLIAGGVLQRDCFAGGKLRQDALNMIVEKHDATPTYAAEWFGAHQ